MRVLGYAGKGVLRLLDGDMVRGNSIPQQAKRTILLLVDMDGWLLLEFSETLGDVEAGGSSPDYCEG